MQSVLLHCVTRNNNNHMVNDWKGTISVTLILCNMFCEKYILSPIQNREIVNFVADIFVN